MVTAHGLPLHLQRNHSCRYIFQQPQPQPASTVLNPSICPAEPSINIRMRWRYAQPLPTTLLPVLLMTTHCQLALCIPQLLFQLQSDFAALQLPVYALTCFVNNVLTDGCANKTDLTCHCRAGDIIRKAMVCLKQGCNQVERAIAISKVQAACGSTHTCQQSGRLDTYFGRPPAGWLA